MNDEVQEMKINNLEKSFETMEKKIDDLPEEIAKRIEESINLKISIAIKEVKLDFYKWLVPIILGLLFSCGGTIFNYIK